MRILPLLALFACGCPSTPLVPGDGAGATDLVSVDASARWYTTCGDPVCRDGEDAGTNGMPCSGQQAGTPCQSVGEECDPGLGCNVKLRCATGDPTQFGCPISRRAAKRDIAYLGPAELERYADELEHIRLATYRYKSAPTAERLGFIIDDGVPAEAVSPGGATVDVYGYASLAVAALQVQAKRIEALSKETAALRAELDRLRRAKH